MRIKLTALALLLVPISVAARGEGTTQVMIVGTYHMNNPGKDLHDSRADDVLTPKRQAEIAATVTAIARFHPTQVDVEWTETGARKAYDKYVMGTLEPVRDESVQLGFRLAKKTGAAVNGIDEQMDFPYP